MAKASTPWAHRIVPKHTHGSHVEQNIGAKNKCWIEMVLIRRLMSEKRGKI